MPADSLPKIVLKPRRAQPFYARHPWVFAGAIQKIPQNIADGQEVIVVASDGKPIARGLFNSHSQIVVRLYNWDVDRPLDRDFWREKIAAAIACRQRCVVDAYPNCRLIFSEADGLSGLIVDQFGDYLSLQLTSLAVSKRLEEICDLLEEQLQPRGIWLRTEKGMTAAEGLELTDGLLRGQSPEVAITIQENGIAYQVDLQHGQKTGFYYDQRENRLAAALYLQGNILDICCYSGGFTLNALKQGKVSSVVAVDSSAPALELAKANAEKNGLNHKVEWITADGLPFLERCEQKFDGIILDPPKFARSRGGIDRALNAYRKWNSAALNLLNPGGILVTCSCSGLVSMDDFVLAVTDAALETGKTVRILEKRGQAADHPVNSACPENAYLKCLIAYVE